MSNKETQTTVRNGGISFCGLLFIALLVLKLVGVIDWSWWWVTAPLWMPVALLIAIPAIMLIVIGLIWIIRTIVKTTKPRKGRRQNGGTK